MKKTLSIFLLVVFLWCGAASAASWYATQSSVDINTATLWVPTSTGSCTGSGTALTWGEQAAGDIFYANGCTALAINVDPGPNGKVTLTTTAGAGTAGGGFTYATATNITIHADLTAGTTNCVAVSGSTGGGSFIGNLQGGGTSGASAWASTHTVVTVSITGTVTSGASTYTYGASINSLTGVLSITGDVTAGVVAAAAYNEGLRVNGGATASVTGKVTGGAYTNPGIAVVSGTVSVTGTLVAGTNGFAVHGPFKLTQNPTDYILLPKTVSYSRGTINGDATLVVYDPGVANVRSGTAYGPNTGTMAAGGGSWGY